MKEELLEPILRKIRIGKISTYIPENAVICDIGCGFEGRFLREISPHIDIGYGFDQKVDTVSEKNIQLFTWNLNNCLPLNDKSVDCITLLAVLEHLSNPEFVFAEILRICRPGGLLVITTPSPRSKPILEFLSFNLGIVNPKEIADHKHYWSLEEIELIFYKFGFKILVNKHFSCGLNTLTIGKLDAL